MQLLTIVEHYVMAAMKRAVPEQLENGIVGATIPECPGVIAFGVADWVKVSLSEGNPLPEIDGIDLNSNASQIVVTYHQGDGTSLNGEFFADESALDAAFQTRSNGPS
jgi:hypothetical protein